MRFFFSGPRILGIRPGISLGPEDFGGRRGKSATQTKPGEPITGSFLYVVRGDHNLVKIGVSTNPSARLATLRTTSAFPIDFAYLACTPGNGFDIEAGAHELLNSHRVNGEWFDVPPEMAVAAISGAAFKLGQPLLQTDAQSATKALAIAAAAAPACAEDIRKEARHDRRWGLLAGFPAWFRWAFTIVLAAIGAAFGLLIGFLARSN